MLKKDFCADLTKFKKLTLIENGDSSQIFLIEDKNSKKLRAARFYAFNLEDFIRKFYIDLQYDINIIFNMNYPSILKCIGLGQSVSGDEKNSVLITKFMANKSLTQVIQNLENDDSSDFWNNTKKLINIYGIACAILYLHKKRIFYGYLTPNKILETRLYHPKIFPYVLNKNDNQNNKQKFYFSPEILANKDQYKISASDDVYSFAMIVYFIMTGEDPFANEMKQKSNEELINEIKQGKRPNFEKPIPYVYQRLIEKCWESNPQKRLSFYKIIDILKNDQRFITDTIDALEYKQYIELIETKDICLLEEEFGLDKINTQKLDFHRFELKKEIGHGGFGDVYKIAEKQTNMKYAAKILQNNDVNEFKRELEIHSCLIHPSFTKLFGYSFLCDKKSIKPMIVSEYIKNGSLENILSKEREYSSLPIWNNTQRLICIFGIASGIKYLHSKKILHLDIKPDNTLLDNYLFPKLIDFGLSKDKNVSPKTDKNLRGTTAFIAPEVFQKGLYSEATDVYAFGILVYEIMTQLVPFKGMCDGNIIYKVAYKNERPLFKKKIPNAYRTLIESCWNKFPQSRPSIEQIVNDLKTNPGFIINNVDKKLYNSYIWYIESSNKAIIDEQFQKFSLKSYFYSLESTPSIVIQENKYSKVIQENKHDKPQELKIKNSHSKVIQENKYDEPQGLKRKRGRRSSYFTQRHKYDENPGLMTQASYSRVIQVNKHDENPALISKKDHSKVIQENKHDKPQELIIKNSHSKVIQENNDENPWLPIQTSASKVIQKNKYDEPQGLKKMGGRRSSYFTQRHKYDENPELKNKEKNHEYEIIYPFNPNFWLQSYPSEFSKSNPFISYVKNLDLNEFTRIEQIGEGKYTKIYKIIENKTNTHYAAKIYNKKYSNEINPFSNDIQLTREIKTISMLNHPSIIKLIGYSKIEFIGHFNPVIITEYIENGSLERILEIERSNSTISFWNDTMRLITIYGIASAMSYLHARNIIYRDLKAENILLDDNLFPKLINFDESRNFEEIDTNTIENSIFTAPEIINNNRYSKEGDVYSFAMLVYEIMAKKYPYEKVNHFKMLHDVAILKKRPEIPNSVPKAYKNLIESCWNHKSKERLTFDQILNNLRTNKEFITKDVDKNLYFAYIQYLENQFNGKYDSTIIEPFKKFKVSFSSLENTLQIHQTETKLYIPSNIANISPSFNIFGTFAGPISHKNNYSETSKSKVQSYNLNNLKIEVSLCIEIK